MFFKKHKKLKMSSNTIAYLMGYKRGVEDARLTSGILEESKKLDIVPLYTSIETPLPSCKEYGRKDLAYLLGQELEKQDLIDYSIEFNDCLGIWVHKATIKVVRS